MIWDDKKKIVKVFKPNVHMMTNSKNSIFGVVNRNTKVTFNVFAQIDSLKVNISAFRVIVEDPNGRETLIEDVKMEIKISLNGEKRAFG